MDRIAGAIFINAVSFVLFVLPSFVFSLYSLINVGNFKPQHLKSGSAFLMFYSYCVVDSNVCEVFVDLGNFLYSVSFVAFFFTFIKLNKNFKEGFDKIKNKFLKKISFCK